MPEPQLVPPELIEELTEAELLKLWRSLTMREKTLVAELLGAFGKLPDVTRVMVVEMLQGMTDPSALPDA